MAQLTRKRVILIEAESSYGTDPTPAATDVVLVTDLSITPQSSDVVNRDVVRPYLGSSQQLLANTRVECTFSVEFCGSGSAVGGFVDVANHTKVGGTTCIACRPGSYSHHGPAPPGAPEIDPDTFLPNTEANLKALRLVGPYVAYGKPNYKTVTDLLHRKAMFKAPGSSMKVRRIKIKSPE